jgi:SAM-dependent methyltransferase
MRSWCGRPGPNQFVADLVADLTPGRAIDLAAGEGRNAIWLAEQGWDATAVDFSEVAIGKAREIAERRGVAITTEVADLTAYEPSPGEYDLVVIAYLQIPAEQLDPVLARAAAAVAPGGTFLLVNHDRANLDGGYGGPQHPSVLTTPPSRWSRRSAMRSSSSGRRWPSATCRPLTASASRSTRWCWPAAPADRTGPRT